MSKTITHACVFLIGPLYLAVNSQKHSQKASSFPLSVAGIFPSKQNRRICPLNLVYTITLLSSPKPSRAFL